MSPFTWKMIEVDFIPVLKLYNGESVHSPCNSHLKHQLSERKKKMVKNNSKPSKYAKERAPTSFSLEEFQWQFFVAAGVMVLLSHWPWEKTEAEMQEANTGAKWLICLSR